MQVPEGEGIESDLIDFFDKHFDGRLVIQDHLGFLYVFTLCRLTEFNQVLGIETVISIPLQTRRGP